MKPVKVITCTRAQTVEEFEQRPIFNSLKQLTQLYGDNLFSFELDKTNSGLSATYNKHLTNANRNTILVFVHDDVELNDLFLVEKLNAAPYSVIVLAGGTEMDLTKPKVAWHLCCSRDKLRGEVTHTGGNKVWTTVFGQTPARVMSFDGVFIACHCDAVVDANVTFDEDFAYHFYDLAFALRCNEAKLTAGVTPIHVVHHGLGDSMYSADWEEQNTKFKQKYGN
jgi:GT2 family glycosyltransferase